MTAPPSALPISLRADVSVLGEPRRAILWLADGKALKRGSHTSMSQLRDAILAYVETHNENGKLFRWMKTADELLDMMRRFGIRNQQVYIP